MLTGARLVWYWVSRVRPIPGAVVAAAIVGGSIALAMIAVILLPVSRHFG